MSYDNEQFCPGRKGEKDPLRAAIERLADQYDNTNRDARFAPDAVAWRLRKILADNPVSPPETSASQ